MLFIVFICERSKDVLLDHDDRSAQYVLIMEVFLGNLAIVQYVNQLDHDLAFLFFEFELVRILFRISLEIRWLVTKLQFNFV